MNGNRDLLPERSFRVFRIWDIENQCYVPQRRARCPVRTARHPARPRHRGGDRRVLRTSRRGRRAEIRRGRDRERARARGTRVQGGEHLLSALLQGRQQPLSTETQMRKLTPIL